MKIMNHTIIGRISATLILGMALTPAAQTRTRVDDVREIVRKTKALYDATTTAEVKFEQTSGEGRALGLLVFGSGDRFRLELPKQTIVSNGQKVWTYMPGKSQVVVSNATRGAGRLTPSEILTAFPGDYATELVGDKTVNGRPVWVVSCTPGSGRKIGDVTKATLYIDKSSYRFQQVDVESPSLGRVSVKITSARYGVKLTDDRFTFTAPQGVRVVDLSK
jgi:outer membrane lipoprotein carrier protein